MSNSKVHNDWVGRVVDGKYTLLQWLGGTESSGVFLTELPGRPSQTVAIKLIPADVEDAKVRIASWEAAATLSHPNLMPLSDSGRCRIDDSDLLYAVTEYAEEILSHLLPERPLTPSEAGEMLGPVLDALSYFHGKGFVHGRLKPSKIMVVNERLKLSGDSLHVVGEVEKRHSPLSVYDAPEVATGTIYPASDLWSLGITLIEALTQQPPVWERAKDWEPIVPESIPEPFAGIARECLRSDPAHRCALGDVRARLEPTQSIAGPAEKTGKATPAKFRVAALVAAVFVLLALAAVLLPPSRTARPAAPAEVQQPVPAVAATPPQAPIPPPKIPKAVPVNDAVVERVVPDVPPKASETIQGVILVSIRVAVDPDGNVADATFESPGGSKYFANLALQAARQWRFKPLLVDGQAVSSAWILQFTFTQTEATVTPIRAGR